MFAKIAAWLGGALVFVLAGVGVLSLVLVWQFFGWLGSWGQQGKGGDAAPVVQVQTVEPVPVVDSVPVAGCECSAGAECVGPRGGRYCLDAAGRKKYKGQP